MNDVRPGWVSTEFWAKVGSWVVNLVVLLVLFGVAKPQDQESLTKAVSEVFAAVAVIAGNVYGLVAYIKGRTAVKVAALGNKS